MDTRPRTIGSTAPLIALVVAALVLLTFALTDNGPTTPGLFNNSRIPAHLVLTGGTTDTVNPGGTTYVPAGATWIVPRGIVCTWHHGKGGAPIIAAGGPPEPQGNVVPITTYTTVEGCIHVVY